MAKTKEKKIEPKLSVRLNLHAVVAEIGGNKELGQGRYKHEQIVTVPKKDWDRRWRGAIRYLTTGRFVPQPKKGSKKK